MVETFDVIVCGGGPGGSSSAVFLSKKGFKVLLLEKAKYPRDKTCGDAISGKSTSLLRELGLNAEVEAKQHAEITGVTFSSPSGALVEIPFKAAKGQARGTGYVCKRMVYDNILFQNMKKQPNVTVKEQFMVQDVLKDEKGFVIGVKALDMTTKQVHEFHSKVVIGADGATSVVAAKLGMNERKDDHNITAIRLYYKGIKNLTGNIEIHFIKECLPGYFWIFPVGNNEANVGVGMVTSDMKKLGSKLDEITFKAIKENPLFTERFKDAELIDPVKGWQLPVASYHKKAHGNGFVLIGDAASLIDPFSGEGIGNAMLSAKYATERIKEAFDANDFSEAFLKTYEDRLWAEIGNEIKTSYALQKIGRITPLLNLVLGKAAKNKEIRETISGMLGSEDAKQNL
ncbi:MAG: NAD(P)/FAD-dependent oxidoreductase, partial [Candidatus Diapherotrites archaeon]|nr:NAD(P)/FAD-dependent oxidoreductase [Candidatus Diapherotrites archaeon]